MALSVFMMLYHPHLVLELFHRPQRKLRAHEALAGCYSLLPPPSPRQLRICFPPLSVCLDISYKRSHTTRGHLSLASFTEHSVFGGHPFAAQTSTSFLSRLLGSGLSLDCMCRNRWAGNRPRVYLGHSSWSPGELELSFSALNR